MKNNRFLSAIVLFAFTASMVGCETEPEGDGPEQGEIRVEAVEWKDDLKNGAELELSDNSMNVANRMDIIPADATNQEQVFSSSNVAVATVSEYGQISPKAIGKTFITVTVDEKSASFELSVIPDKKPEEVPVTEISIEETEITVVMGEKKDLSSLFVVLPETATDRSVSYEMDKEDIVSVSDAGELTGEKEGTVTVTVRSNGNPEVSGEIKVTVTPFYGDYSRDNWTSSIPEIGTFIENKDGKNINIVDRGMFDNDFTTFLGLVKPGKTHGRVTVEMNPPVSKGGATYFIVDMKEPLAVNYFRIRHKLDVDLRWWKFTSISGSNDGQNFTEIAKDVAVTGYEVSENPESPNIPLKETTYRYLKFYANTDDCWNPESRNSVQIVELYIGRSKQDKK